jgi:N-acetylmuramoyl-L-alanine amidase
MGQYWAQSVRRRRRLERIILVVLLATIPVVVSTQINPSAASAAPGGVYVVVRGDNLGSIARRNGTTVSAIAQANGIRNVNFIRIGMRLNIPGNAVPAAAPTAAPAPAASGKFPRTLLTHPDRVAYDAYFNKWADANGIPRDLLKSICYMESGWSSTAVSRTGARGIGQLLPSTANFVKTNLIGHRELDINNPEDNIRMSARYIWYLLKLNGGNQQAAAASYYQAYTSIRRTGMHADTNSYVQTVFPLRGYFA